MYSGAELNFFGNKSVTFEQFWIWKLQKVKLFGENLYLLEKNLYGYKKSYNPRGPSPIFWYSLKLHI